MGPDLAGDCERIEGDVEDGAMSMIRRIFSTCRNLRHRGRMESDLDAELRAYVDLAEAEKVRSGMGAAEARRTAVIESGGVEQEGAGERRSRGRVDRRFMA